MHQVTNALGSHLNNYRAFVQKVTIKMLLEMLNAKSAHWGQCVHSLRLHNHPLVLQDFTVTSMAFIRQDRSALKVFIASQDPKGTTPSKMEY